jgi:hypothetical protein
MNPLNFIIDDSSLRHQRIETTTIYPRTINDNSSGGLVRFVLPNKGFLSANTCIQIPATCVEECYQYAPNAGIYSLLKTARMVCGDQVISEIQNVGQLLAQKKLAESQEIREKMSQVKEGINLSFECGSGSKRDGDLNNMEVLQGQQRLVMDKYEQEFGMATIAGRKMAFPNILNGKLHDSYKLKTFSDDTATEAGTPEFFIYLRDLFHNYFGAGLELPLQLINRNEEISIEIQFSSDGALSENERAIFCPSLQSKKLTGVTALALASSSGTMDAGHVNEKGVVKEINEGTTGTNLWVSIDFNAGDISDMRILNCGSGYTGAELTLVYEGKTFNFVPAFRHLSSASTLNNFYISSAGSGYTAGQAQIISKVNPDVKANVTIGVNGSGGVNAIEYEFERDKDRFLFAPNQEYSIVKGTANNATVKPAVEYLELTNLGALAGTFVVGDVVKSSNDENARAVVNAVDGDDKPTQLYYFTGTFADGDSVIDVDDANNTCVVGNFRDADGEPDESLAIQAGLNSTSQYGFDNNENNGRIKIQTDKVIMLADIIYYEDDTVANMMKQMSQGGVQQVYTEFRNVVTTLKQDAVSDYNASNKTEHIRLIGFSNEILRNLLIQNIPAPDTQTDVNFPNKNLALKNPLLGQYCSRDSVADAGVELNVVVNSVPFFASPMNFNPQFYEELTYCHNAPLYVPHSAYCAYTSAKQLDNNSADTSQQPAFSDLDSLTEQTQRFEINERCAGMCNQLYEGIGQENLIGNLNYMGVSFMTSPAKGAVGNGVAVGSQAVEIQYTYTNTYNPLYNGNSTLNVYGEVERRLVLDENGRISVSSASAMRM